MSSGGFAHHKRKLSDPSATSDTSSGRFDDADESDSGAAVDEVLETRSVHSAKRGRSNGWPLRDELAYDEHGMKIDLSERRFPSKVPVESPRSSKREPVLRVRRSRFIEGSMNDDHVSEKPPSVLFQDVPRTTGSTSDDRSKPSNHLEKRGSGIFRFGKAIASAFHPFGAWGNKSDASSHDASKAQKELMKQRQARAEKTYAELKKSGFKGIGTPMAVDPDAADETWNAIQETMDYRMAADDRASPDHSRRSREQNVAAEPPTPACDDTGLSKFKSLSDLRKRTSTLNLPSMRQRDVSPAPAPSDRESEDSHAPVQRRQSRRDLSRQARLLKKVSNLEDKLDRARRELRELANPEEESSLPSICLDDSHTRKFVPGALPSLPSERLLHDQAGADHPAKSHDNNNNNDSEPERRMRSSASPKQPRKLSKARRPAGKDSLSPRKRKSSAEPTNNKGQPSDEGGGENHDPNIASSNTPRKASLRQSKSQKTARADSPGAAKSLQPDNNGNNNANRVITERGGGSARKPTRDKRSSSLTTKSSQRLKAKQSSRNLRPVAMDDDAGGNSNRGPFYLQEQHHLDGNILKVPPTSPSPSSSPKKNKKATTPWEDQDEENIPPVPPLPKELLEKNATEMIGGATAGRRLEKIDEANSPRKRIPSTGFTWPEDIF
jgi:hypothetical protein